MKIVIIELIANNHYSTIMKNKSLLLFAMFFLFSALLVTAQKPEKKACPCCTKAHQAFDFWIGDWTVYDMNGKIVGTNSIKKEYDKCVLKEQWKSSSINRGTSYNYYDLKDKTWNQVWIDNSGFSLVLKGHFIDGKMILKSKLLASKKGNYYNQITWMKNDDNSVTQT